MVSIYGGSGGGGFDYVQDPQPSEPTEGEEWYDTDGNAAYVYDGAEWIEETITTHDKLSGVTSDQHHAPPTSTDSHVDRTVYGSGNVWSSGHASTNSVNIGAVVDQISYTFQESTGSQNTYTIRANDIVGGTAWEDTHSVPGDTTENNTHTFATPVFIESLYLDSSSNASGGWVKVDSLRLVENGLHSHPINS